GDLPTGASIRQIVAGAGHTCALASDNKAYCWGWGSNGQLGNDTTTGTQATPAVVSQGSIPAGASLQNVAAGNSHACVIADGHAHCWGSGANGRLGTGAALNSLVPTA